MATFEQWVHVKITDKELAGKLDEMSAEDERDRSKFVRWLIQQEYLRRHPVEAHWVGGASTAPTSTSAPLPSRAHVSVKNGKKVKA